MFIGKQLAKTENLQCAGKQCTSRLVGFMFFGCFCAHGRVIASYYGNEYNPLLGFVIKSQAALSKSVCNSTESD